MLEAMKAAGGVAIGDDEDGGGMTTSQRSAQSAASTDAGQDPAVPARARATPTASPSPHVGNGPQFPGGALVPGESPRVVHAGAVGARVPKYSSNDELEQKAAPRVLRASSRVSQPTSPTE